MAQNAGSGSISRLCIASQSRQAVSPGSLVEGVHIGLLQGKLLLRVFANQIHGDWAKLQVQQHVTSCIPTTRKWRMRNHKVKAP